MTAQDSIEVKAIEASELGAGPADRARCASLAIEALSSVAGVEFVMTSLALEVTSHELEAGEVSIRSRVDKRSRFIVFASAEAWQGERLVFSAQGLFSLQQGSCGASRVIRG
jgi:hypothetical protein